MKAIERIRDIATQVCALEGVAFAVRGGRLHIDPDHTSDVFARSVGCYLDEEAERRAEFEADILDRLARLEALNPEVRTVVGSTLGGCTVHGLDASPLRLGKHGDPHQAHHPACKKSDDHQGHCIDPKGYEPTEEIEEP